MTQYISYNDNKYDVKKLLLIKGEGSRVQYDSSKLLNLDKAFSSNETDGIVTVPFCDKFHVLVKTSKEITNKTPVYILSKFLLKKIKYSPEPVVISQNNIFSFNNTRPTNRNNNSNRRSY